MRNATSSTNSLENFPANLYFKTVIALKRRLLELLTQLTQSTSSRKEVNSHYILITFSISVAIALYSVVFFLGQPSPFGWCFV